MKPNIQSIFYILILIVGTVLSGISQTKVQGVIIDSAHNNILRAVSVSVFEKGKSTVEKVALTDAYGKFMIEDLVVGKPYTIQFTFTGYQKIFRDLMLNAKEEKNLGHINMPFVENEIEVVEIMPPVRMNGDTLEFNADAFQLDTNAVVEDLLRKLPGLVVWGDGAVTYNGKEIPSILVNGKPFFGNDMSIALQNIQKDAVKKIQVYDSRDENKKLLEPEDKNYQMNLVLKEGKDKMYFGNVGAGLGTDQRYSGHLNFNISDKKKQGTIAYSTNNVNKRLYNVDQLLKNTTFKGVGVNADFDSDFLTTGIQREHVLGGRYQHDIIGSNQVGKQHLIKGDILSSWRANMNENRNSTQLLSENDTEQNFRTYKSVNNSNAIQQNGSFNYNNNTDTLLGRPISIYANLYANNSTNTNDNNSFTEYQYTNNKSTNEIDNSSENNNRSLSFNTNINIQGKSNVIYYGDKSKKYNYWENINYTIGLSGSVESSNSNAINIGDYVNFDDETKNKYTFRRYDSGVNGKRFGMSFSANEYKSRLRFNFDAHYYGTISSNMVVDQLTTGLVENANLSHESDYNQYILKPSLSWGKSLYNKYLHGRGYTNLQLNTSLGMNFYQDENVSNLDFRNLKISYTTVVPSLSLDYSKSKSNVYNSSLRFNYGYSEEYPFLDRMRPFYDDINPAYRNYGSVYKLRATGVHDVGISGSYSQVRQYGYKLNGRFNYKNYIRGLTDSVVYVENQQQLYTAQMNKSMDLFSGGVDFSKPYLIGKSQTFTVNVNGNFNWGNKFQYLNNSLQEMLNNGQNLALNFYYTVVDKYQIGWKNGANRYRRYNRLDDVISNDYTSYSLNSGVAMSYALTKRWSVNTNGTLRYNTSGDFKDEVFIWNANTTYRLLKGNNLEFKFAAYDLLRQNKGMYFTNGVTEFTTGYSNILTQYYMLSLSYFPRKFGFK